MFVCTAWGIMLCNCVDIAVCLCVQHGEKICTDNNEKSVYKLNLQYGLILAICMPFLQN